MPGFHPMPTSSVILPKHSVCSVVDRVWQCGWHKPLPDGKRMCWDSVTGKWEANASVKVPRGQSLDRMEPLFDPFPVALAFSYKEAFHLVDPYSRRNTGNSPHQMEHSSLYSHHSLLCCKCLHSGWPSI